MSQSFLTHFEEDDVDEGCPHDDTYEDAEQPSWKRLEAKAQGGSS